MATANLTTIKTSDRNFTSIGDTITYTIVTTNIGTGPAINIILTDLIPQGANFIPDTVFINSALTSGVNPALGIALPTLPAGSTTTVTLQARVVNLPTLNPMVNTAQMDYQYDSSVTTIPNYVAVSSDSSAATTTISNPNLIIKKIASPTTYAIGTTITYSINVQNFGPGNATNLTFIDTIPNGTQFIPNSVFGNSTNLPGANPQPPTGVNIGTLNSGFQVTLSFSVLVITVPTPSTLSNTCDIAYTFILDPNTGSTASGRTTTNAATSAFQDADLSGITKSVDLPYATCGNTLTYTIRIPNNGLSTATSVVFNDTLPTSLSFIAGSIQIGTVPYGGTPASIPIGSIAPSTVVTVTFKCLVNC